MRLRNQLFISEIEFKDHVHTHPHHLQSSETHYRKPEFTRANLGSGKFKRGSGAWNQLFISEMEFRGHVHTHTHLLQSLEHHYQLPESIQANHLNLPEPRLAPVDSGGW